MTLWSVPILWWGRAGDILQFFGGITVLAEIIGPQRIRSFGQSLHGRISQGTIALFWTRGWAWYKAMVRYTFMTKRGTPDEERALEETGQYGADNLNILLTLLGTVIVGINLWDNLAIGWWLAVEAATFFFGIITVFPIFTMLIIVVAAGVGFLLDILLIEPLAWILERPSLDRLVKLFALLLLIIGFHFDLLAS
jgi:hypothetical protein